VSIERGEFCLLETSQHRTCRDKGILDLDAFGVISQATNIPKDENKLFEGHTIH
jgi:hypothetical protein